MNIVFLTSHAIHQYYLINEIHKFSPVKKVFFQTIHEKQTSWKNRFLRLLSPKKCRFILRHLMARILFYSDNKKQEKYEREAFFSNAVPTLDSSIPSEEVLTFNSEEAVRKVKKEEPDLIIVFGTDILKGNILNIAKLDILNIHRDILPKYRGGGLPCWVFYNNDFKNMGTTVHVCSKDLDAGAIVGQKFYMLQRDDRIYTVRYKTTRLAVDILKELIEKYKNNTVFYREFEKTKLLTSKDLTLFKELRARKNLKKYIKDLRDVH